MALGVKKGAAGGRAGHTRRWAGGHPKAAQTAVLGGTPARRQCCARTGQPSGHHMPKIAQVHPAPRMPGSTGRAWGLRSPGCLSRCVSCARTARRPHHTGAVLRCGALVRRHVRQRAAAAAAGERHACSTLWAGRRGAAAAASCGQPASDGRCPAGRRASVSARRAAGTRNGPARLGRPPRAPPHLPARPERSAGGGPMGSACAPVRTGARPRLCPALAAARERHVAPFRRACGDNSRACMVRVQP